MKRRLKREAEAHRNDTHGTVSVDSSGNNYSCVNREPRNNIEEKNNCKISPRFNVADPPPSNSSGHVQNTNDKISIIIAVKNESRVIGKTLRNLESTTKRKNLCEIIIVDKGCVDNSIDVAKASSCCIKVTFIRSTDGLGRGSALNAGASIATGNILLFLRSDCLVPDCFDEVCSLYSCHSICLTSAFMLHVFCLTHAYVFPHINTISL